VKDILRVTPLCAMIFDVDYIDAEVSLSGVNPVTEPDSRAVLTPTILEAEFGFFMKLIVNTIC
jgi:hypothetical protein